MLHASPKHSPAPEGASPSAQNALPKPLPFIKNLETPRFVYVKRAHFYGIVVINKNKWDSPASIAWRAESPKTRLTEVAGGEKSVSPTDNEVNQRIERCGRTLLNHRAWIETKEFET